MSEMLRELIDEGRKMKSIELYKQGKVGLGLGAKIARLSIIGIYGFAERVQGQDKCRY